jgi:hypothetical protein
MLREVFSQGFTYLGRERIIKDVYIKNCKSITCMAMQKKTHGWCSLNISNEVDNSYETIDDSQQWGELVAIEKLLNIVITLEHIESRNDVFHNEYPKIKYYMDMPRNHVATTQKKPTKITINIDEPTCEVEE